MFWPRNEFLLLPPPTLPISSLSSGGRDGDGYVGDDADVGEMVRLVMMNDNEHRRLGVPLPHSQSHL